jgi:hypothetical protein
MYVLVTPAKHSFVSDFASIVRAHGLDPSIGQATDDRGHTLNVVEAKGQRMRVWSQNMPLSGQEDSTSCGRHTEAYPDPGQYIVRVRPAWWILGEAAAVELSAQLRQELSKIGYEVRDKPATCSPWAKMAPGGQ